MFVDSSYSEINTIERDQKVEMKLGRKNDINANERGRNDDGCGISVQTQKEWPVNKKRRNGDNDIMRIIVEVNC